MDLSKKIKDEQSFSKENTLILHLMDAVFQRVKKLEELTNCVLHSVCKSNDEKTEKAIHDYLKSNYRNRREN